MPRGTPEDMEHMGLFNLFGRKPYERAGFELYTASVRAARVPYFFGNLGVPDTLDGRFDMVGLFVFLVVNRLHAASAEGKKLAQAVFDAMFLDMDINLREIGISDMRIGKSVKDMWTAFNGRSVAYAAALASDDPEALASAIARNVWRGREADDNARALARMVMAQHRHLQSQPDEALFKGQPGFLPTAEAVA